MTISPKMKTHIYSVWCFLYFSFLASFFLTLGNDDPTLINFRIWWGYLLFFSFFAFHLRSFRLNNFSSLTLLLFFLFLMYEFVRLIWGLKQGAFELLIGPEKEMYLRYVEGFFIWLFGFFSFVVAYPSDSSISVP